MFLINVSLAATFTVDSLADEHDYNPGDGICNAAGPAERSRCTLRAAVQEANATSAIDTVELASGTHPLVYGQLWATSPLSVVGQGAGTSIIDAGSSSRVFYANSGLVLEDATLQNGWTNSYGGLVYGVVEAVGVSFLSGQVLYDGGAVYNTGNSTFSDCVFSGNSASRNGGAISNHNTYRGAGTVTIDGSTFTANTAGQRGGALFSSASLGSSYSFDVTDSLFSLNTSGSSGGGAYLAHSTISDSTFDRNEGTNGGGAVVFYSDITGSVFTSNEATYGGGVALSSSTLTFSSVEDNSASRWGGGVYAANSDIGRTAIVKNTSDDSGGGLFAYSGASGGSLTDSTVVGNEAAYGGGVYGWTQFGGNFKLVNVTVAENEGLKGVGGVGATSGMFVVQNAIVESNKAPASPDCGSLKSLQDSLVGDTTGCSYSGSNVLANQSANLGTWTDTGVAGEMYYVLPNTSSAYNQGSSCSAYDQLGIFRSQCSMGSVEP
jgi:large repetitive protein